MQNPRHISLDDPACLDPARSGAKAARLAEAHERGLPVLPGIVLPANESVPALRHGLARGEAEGVHGARLALMQADTSHLAQLPAAAGELGSILAVRSSSPLEGTGESSGAFTSFLDVRPHEIRTAVRGVWASAVDSGVPARLPAGQHDTTRPDSDDVAGMAVLIQPQIRPDVSGSAEADDAGSVHVVTVTGPPAPLMSGWEPGLGARVRADGTVTGPDAVAAAGEQVLRRVAELARVAHRDLGAGMVEWAALAGGAGSTRDDAGGDAGGVVLLQTTRVSRAPGRTANPPRRDRAQALPPGALRAARAVLDYGGDTGERLVLPWLLAGEHGDGPEGPGGLDRLDGDLDEDTNPAGEAGGRARSPAARGTTAEAVAAWDQATALARTLTAQTWGPDVTPRAAATLEALRGDDAARALDTLAGLPATGQAAATRVFALLRRVADRLVETGLLDRAQQLWTLPEHAVRGLLEGGQQPPELATVAHRAALRWEPFVHGATMNLGARVAGEPASPGSGAGPLVYLEARPGRLTLPPRAVLVAPRPLPHLSPLLWGASALVTFGGSPAAHLAEVARSLAVPAVVACPGEGVLAQASAGTPVAVDGDRGVVAAASGQAGAEPAPARRAGATGAGR